MGTVNFYKINKLYWMGTESEQVLKATLGDDGDGGVVAGLSSTEVSDLWEISSLFKSFTLLQSTCEH